MMLTKSDILETITHLADKMESVGRSVARQPIGTIVKGDINYVLNRLNQLEHDLEEEINGA